MTGMIVDKDILNNAACDNPDCGHDHSTLFLHSNCHNEAPTWTRYQKDIETLIITCAECDEEIIRIRL
jgi:hypothetical protein